MMRRTIRGSIAAAMLFLALGMAQAQPAPVQSLGTNVAHRILANGMEVFVLRNSSVPLATICVALRGGAIAHTPRSARLSHL